MGRAGLISIVVWVEGLGGISVVLVGVGLGAAVVARLCSVGKESRETVVITLDTPLNLPPLITGDNVSVET